MRIGLAFDRGMLAVFCLFVGLDVAHQDWARFWVNGLIAILLFRIVSYQNDERERDERDDRIRGHVADAREILDRHHDRERKRRES